MGYRFADGKDGDIPLDFKKAKGLSSFSELPPEMRKRLDSAAQQVSSVINASMESKAGLPEFSDVAPEVLYKACMVEFMAHLQVMINDLFEICAVMAIKHVKEGNDD